MANASIPQRLYALLNGEAPDILRWIEPGTAFIVHDSQRLSALLDVDTTANLEAHGFIRGEASEAGVQWFVRGEPDLGTFGAPTRAAASPGLVRPNHLELPPNDPSRGPVLYPSGLVGASGSPDLSYGAAPWGPSPTMMVAQPMPPPPSHLDGLEQRVLGLDGQIRAMSDLCARIQQTRDATRMLQSEVALHSLAVLDDIVGSDAHEQRQLITQLRQAVLGLAPIGADTVSPESAPSAPSEFVRPPTRPRPAPVPPQPAREEPLERRTAFAASRYASKGNAERAAAASASADSDDGPTDEPDEDGEEPDWKPSAAHDSGDDGSDDSQRTTRNAKPRP